MPWLSGGWVGLRRVICHRFARLALIAVAAMLSLGQQSAEAGTFNVNSTADILNPPAGVVTLRSAIQAANSTAGGNTINLTLPGTYRITLPGANTGTNASGAFAILPGGGDLSVINTSGGVVVVDAGGLDRVFDINPTFNPASPTPAFTVTMQGLTITNGSTKFTGSATDNGGGIAARGNTSLALTDMVVTLNEAQSLGGGIFIGSLNGSFNWTLTLNNSTISNNFAFIGGGIAAEGSGNIVINSGSSVTGNSGAFGGGGIALDNSQAVNLTIQGADIGSNHVLSSTQNTPGNDGGGIFNFGTGAVVISNSTIHDNSADNGGGFASQGGSTLSVSNTHFVNNNAGQVGGAIASFNSASSISIAFSEIDGNSSGSQGGGIFASGVTFVLQNSTVANNSTLINGGGGIELQTTGTGVNGSQITNSTITGNSGLTVGRSSGGGIDAAASFTGSLALLGDTITSNVSAGGGGVFWAGTTGSSVTVQDTIIANNHADAPNGQATDATNGVTPFTDNGGNLIGMSGAGSGNTGFTNPTTQTGTTSAPLDPVLGSLQDNGGPTRTLALLSGSPAIDKGVASSLTTDQRGVPRPQGPQPDVGAYELNQGATPMASLSTNNLDFGTQGLTTSTPLNETITNTGTGGLIISNVTVSGPNAGDFSFTPQAACTPLPTTLPGGQFCRDTVTFTPSAGGPRSATLVFTDNHLNAPNSRQAVTLTGSGGVGAPDFSVSASPASATITRGGSASFTFTVTPVNGFNQSVTFSCTGLPTLAQCSFAPASVTPNGSAVTTALTITTTAPVTAMNHAPEPPNNSDSVYASLGFAGFALGLVVIKASDRRRRKRVAGLFFATAVLCVMSVLAGCGGTQTVTKTVTVSPGTPTGTSAVKVFSSSGGNAHSASVTLTVN